VIHHTVKRVGRQTTGRELHGSQMLRGWALSSLMFGEPTNGLTTISYDGKGGSMVPLCRMKILASQPAPAERSLFAGLEHAPLDDERASTVSAEQTEWPFAPWHAAACSRDRRSGWRRTGRAIRGDASLEGDRLSPTRAAQCDRTCTRLRHAQRRSEPDTPLASRLGQGGRMTVLTASRMRLVRPVRSAHASRRSHVASASTLTCTRSHARSRWPVRAIRSLHSLMPIILTVLAPLWGRSVRVVNSCRRGLQPRTAGAVPSARWFRDPPLNNWNLEK
jgi:hypothetical protein